MISFYKKNIQFITDHAVDPDKRRSVVKNEAANHYLDIDYYGKYPYLELPRRWDMAITKYSIDTIRKKGILPWNIQIMLLRLTNAFKKKDYLKILKTSADIGHYIADAHVPLHTNSNHNGQLTNQMGIHAFWESRVPELLAEKKFNFYIGKALYIKNPVEFIWENILESAQAADSVLCMERELSDSFTNDKKYSFELRNKIIIKQYSSAYTIAYNNKLNGMVERRMRKSIFSIASLWYTAWVDAGQPDLEKLSDRNLTKEETTQFDELDDAWKNSKSNYKEHE